jgi:hypothetical protein
MTSPSKRDEMRQVFYEAWRKHKQGLLLESLESIIIDIILWHPEYHSLFDHPEKSADIEFNDSNPFLHISLHLAIREQIAADSPRGIRLIYQHLCNKFHDSHFAEHQMLECLGKMLWDAQETGSLPDEQYYLDVLKRLG